ncbi:MAG: hypothetical protein WDL87_10635 [Candidatus Omnitrophota bacterium]|jgi:hypothetical protein
MKKTIIIFCAVMLCLLGVKTYCLASDWDTAGKAFAIIEGLRVITGGQLDVVGSITGINRPREIQRERVYVREEPVRSYSKVYGHAQFSAYGHRRQPRYSQRIWVPHMVWEEKYVPTHTEYRPGYGEIVIESHYERFQVQQGGHWEIVYSD